MLAVLPVGESGGLGDAATVVDPAGRIARAVEVAGFRGKAMATLDIIAPAESPADRILLVGVGDSKSMTEHDWARLGGQICGKFEKSTKVIVHLSLPGVEIGGAEAAEVAMGMLLRAYRFDRYKTRADDGENSPDRGAVKVVFVTSAAAAAKKAFEGVGLSSAVSLSRAT
jgi:leucyl aminopeptidase